MLESWYRHWDLCQRDVGIPPGYAQQTESVPAKYVFCQSLKKNSNLATTKYFLTSSQRPKSQQTTENSIQLLSSLQSTSVSWQWNWIFKGSFNQTKRTLDFCLNKNQPSFESKRKNTPIALIIIQSYIPKEFWILNNPRTFTKIISGLILCFFQCSCADSVGGAALLTISLMTILALPCSKAQSMQMITRMQQSDSNE